MEIYPGELRFCEDCIHRIIVNGLQNNEIRCAKLGYRLGHASEANQCFMSNDFEETARKHLSETLNQKSTGNVSALISGYYSHLKRFRQFAFGESNVSTRDIGVSKKLKNDEIQIPTPCVEELEKYLIKWDELENYHLQENALNKLF